MTPSTPSDTTAVAPSGVSSASAPSAQPSDGEHQRAGRVAGERAVREAGHDDGRLHPGLLVDVLGLEVLALLHGEERRPARVAHDAHAVPRGPALRLRDDVADEGHHGADRLERPERRVGVVGLPARDGVVGPLGTAVVGDAAVLHQVERPERAVILRGQLEPAAEHLEVGRAVAGGGGSVGHRGAFRGAGLVGRSRRRASTRRTCTSRTEAPRWSR